MRRASADFVRHIAVNYVARGYVFYVKGEIPTHKDPAAVEAKLRAKYETTVSKWSRARQKNKGRAKVQFFRQGNQFLLLATPGSHQFFAEEGNAVHDVRRRPLRIPKYRDGILP